MIGRLCLSPAVLAIALAALCATCRRTPPAPSPQRTDATVPTQANPAAPPHWLHATAGEALRQVLRTAKPRIIGFGEFHQKISSAKVRSAVRRFSEQMVATLAPAASDLIVETWVTEGRCGEDERRVVKSVEKTTERPVTTEDEVVTLLKRAKQLGVQPHILKVGCDDYKLLARSRAGKVDYEKLLSMITRHLQQKATQVVAARRRADGAGEPKAVALYGGALHNDLFPLEGLEAFSYAAALQKLTGGRYAELDLYVPEYVEGDEAMRREPWYPLLRLAGPRHVVLIERGPCSYILLLQRGYGSPTSRPAR